MERVRLSKPLSGAHSSSRQLPQMQQVHHTHAHAHAAPPAPQLMLRSCRRAVPPSTDARPGRHTAPLCCLQLAPGVNHAHHGTLSMY
jgi:hypothetical protein